jgi:hypothetical protein
MKSPGDVLHPPDAPTNKKTAVGVFSHLQHAAPHSERALQPPADTSVTTKLRTLHTRPEPATPVEAAAALIELSLQESKGPVEKLSGALVRMAQLIQGHPGDTGGVSDTQRAQIAREMGICIENLQFHDRLTQQLTQVRNLLAALAFSDVPTDVAGRPLEDDPYNWHVLLEYLRARFTSDSHRILFNLLLPGLGGRKSVPPPALHANEGSVELF